MIQMEPSNPFQSGSGTVKHVPKDYLAENVRRMRHIQRESRQKQNQTNAPVKGLWKSSKYDNVSSKVKEQLVKSESKPRPQSANSYLRAHSRTSMTPVAPRLSRSNSADSTDNADNGFARPASANERNRASSPFINDVKLKRTNYDFIKINGISAKNGQMRRSPSLTALDDHKKKLEEEEKNYKRGQVPQYLQSRQKQWQQEEEERIARIPDPDLPPNHRVMPNDERLAMLQKLKTSQQTLNQQLASMPVRTDTLRIRTKKEAIEAKLAEVETAISIFSRSKVFVKEDS